MTVASKDFDVTRNADWAYSARLKKPDGSYHDLAGSIMRMQVRPSDDSDEIVIELNQANGRLAFAAASGDAPGVLSVWSILVDKTVMVNLPKGEFVFDVIWTRGTNDRRIIEGAVRVTNGATR